MPTYDSSLDLQIDWEVETSAGDELMRGFVDLSNVSNYNSSQAQFLTHSVGNTQWLRPYPIRYYDAGEDMELGFGWSSGIFRSFVDANHDHEPHDQRQAGARNQRRRLDVYGFEHRG